MLFDVVAHKCSEDQAIEHISEELSMRGPVEASDV